MATLRLILLFLLLPASLWSNPLLAQSLRCDDAVALRTGRITVAANGVDDTQNIQCALDEAKRLRIPVVRLSDDVYYISSIQIEDFNGALEGLGRDSTTVVVLDASIDCAQMGENGQHPAAIKFIKGNAELRWMTIGSDTPCSRPWSPPSFILVHFTGTNKFAECANETGFGSVNRVNLVSVAPKWLVSGQFVHGVGARPEALRSNGSCRDMLMGAFRLERSFLGGFDDAVRLMLRASALVDIRFSDFVDNVHDVFSIDADQRLTIQSNTMVRIEEIGDSAVLVGNGYPYFRTRQDRLVVYRNTFSMEAGSPIAIAADGFSNRSIEISANRFAINSDREAVVLWATYGANVTNNVFEGSGLNAVNLVGDPSSDRLEPGNNNITGNDFTGFCAVGTDVFLDENTSGNIMGPGQNARVEDLGSGNYVLGEFDTPAKSDCDISAISQSERVQSAKAKYLELRSRIAAMLESRESDSA